MYRHKILNEHLFLTAKVYVAKLDQLKALGCQLFPLILAAFPMTVWGETKGYTTLLSTKFALVPESK